MQFNPIFLKLLGLQNQEGTAPPSKLKNSSYLFSDILKVYSDAKESGKLAGTELENLDGKNLIEKVFNLKGKIRSEIQAADFDNGKKISVTPEELLALIANLIDHQFMLTPDKQTGGSENKKAGLSAKDTAVAEDIINLLKAEKSIKDFPRKNGEEAVTSAAGNNTVPEVKILMDGSEPVIEDGSSDQSKKSNIVINKEIDTAGSKNTGTEIKNVNKTTEIKDAGGTGPKAVSNDSESNPLKPNHDGLTETGKGNNYTGNKSENADDIKQNNVRISNSQKSGTVLPDNGYIKTAAETGKSIIAESAEKFNEGNEAVSGEPKLIKDAKTGSVDVSMPKFEIFKEKPVNDNKGLNTDKNPYGVNKTEKELPSLLSRIRNTGSFNPELKSSVDQNENLNPSEQNKITKQFVVKKEGVDTFLSKLLNKFGISIPKETAAEKPELLVHRQQHSNPINTHHLQSEIGNLVKEGKPVVLKFDLGQTKVEVGINNAGEKMKIPKDAGKAILKNFNSSFHPFNDEQRSGSVKKEVNIVSNDNAHADLTSAKGENNIYKHNNKQNIIIEENHPHNRAADISENEFEARAGKSSNNEHNSNTFTKHNTSVHDERTVKINVNIRQENEHVKNNSLNEIESFAKRKIEMAKGFERNINDEAVKNSRPEKVNTAQPNNISNETIKPNSNNINPVAADQQTDNGTESGNHSLSDDQKSSSNKKESQDINSIGSASQNRNSNSIKEVPKILSYRRPQPQITKTIKSSEILKEISKFVSGKEKSSMVLKLMPEELGKIKVTLDVIEKHLHAHVEVENQAVKNVVQNNMEVLRQSLMQNGVQLSSFNVSLTNSEKRSGKTFEHKKKNQSIEHEAVIDENETAKADKKLGYNTYEYLV